LESYVRAAMFNDDIKKQSSHYHDCHQIIFIKKGEIEININGKVKTAKSDDIIIVSRFENHSIKVLSPIYERYILRINNNLPFDNKVFSIFTNRPQNFSNIISVAERNAEFNHILVKIVNEINLNDSLSIQLQNMLINELLIYVYRLLPKESINFDNENFNQIVKLKQEFETNYQLQYNLKELANKYNMSTSTLSHSFKKIVGISVFDYLLSCRIAAAKRYLTKTDLTIGEIVEKCGFTDNSNFSRTFKKLNSISPTAFRNKFGSLSIVGGKS